MVLSPATSRLKVSYIGRYTFSTTYNYVSIFSTSPCSFRSSNFILILFVISTKDVTLIKRIRCKFGRSYIVRKATVVIPKPVQLRLHEKVKRKDLYLLPLSKNYFYNSITFLF